jgi:hypothetical protein
MRPWQIRSRSVSLRKNSILGTEVRDAYLRLRENGYHLIYREFDELGDRTYDPPSNDDALAWATRLRNKNIALSPEETKLLKAFAGEPPAAVNGYYPSLALVGGALAGAVLQKLFGSKDPAVRAAAAETCRHAIFDNAPTVELSKLLSDPFRQSAAVHDSRPGDVCQLAVRPHTARADRPRDEERR